MMNRKINRKQLLVKITRLGVATLMTSAFMTGCGGKEEKPKPVSTAYVPPVAPPPPVASVTDLQSQMGTDDRIIWNENDAPFDTEERKAILSFVDGFANTDVDAIRPQLTLVDQLELDQLSKNPHWNGLGEDLRMIELQAGVANGQKCLLVIYQVGYVFQPQMWYYSQSGDSFLFESVWTPPDMMNKLSGGWGNWIESWHDIIQEELEVSDEPDVELVSLEDFLESSSTSDADGGGKGSGGNPGKGGGGSPNSAPGFAPNGLVGQ